MNNVIAVVKTVVGQVMALSPDGAQRLLVEGDRLFRGEQVLTGEAGLVSLQLKDGQTVELGSTSQWPAVEQQEQDATASTTPPAQDLQQAIASGMDPTTDLAPTAAGPAPGSGSSTGIAGGHGFVMLDATASQVDVQVGFETRGLDFSAPLTEQEDLIDDFTPSLAEVPVDPVPETPVPQPPLEEPEPPVEEPEPPIEEPEPPVEEPEQPEPQPPVPPANTPPIAVADSFTLLEGGSISGNLLSNDFDNDGDSLSITSFTLSTQPLVSQPLGSPITIPFVGTLQINANGTFSFNPLPNYNGPVPVITYTVSDGSSIASTTVSIDITPVNDAPFHIVPQAQTTPEDTPLTFSLQTSNALGAFDVDLDSLTTTLNVQHGVLEVGLNLLGVTVTGGGTSTLTLSGSPAAINNAMAQLKYTPDANYHGPDTLSISTTDGQETATDSVAITVTPVNDAPVGAPETNSGPEDSIVTGNLLTNATDVDGDSLSIASFNLTGSPLTQYPVGTPINIPQVGTLQIDADGTYTFTPQANYNGNVPQVTFTLTDGTDTATSTLDITITPDNDAPIIHVPTAQTTPEDTSKVFSLATTNAIGVFDPELDNLTVTLSVEHGVLNVGLNALGAGVSGDGSSALVLTGSQAAINNAMAQLRYTPSANYNGPDTLSIVASDGIDSTSDSVAITVTPVNDAPTTSDLGLVTDENVPVNGIVTGTDIEGDTLSFSITGAPGNGTVALNTATGSFTYTPSTNYNGSDSFVVTVSDGNGGFATSTVTIGVNPLNDAPVSLPDSILVAEGGTASTLVGGSTSVLANDSDADGDPLDAILVSGPAHGTLTLNPNGTFSYVHDGSETTTDSFTYRANDGTANGNTVTVSIGITPVNDAPVSVADSIVVAEGGTATVLASGSTSVLANDSDAENDTLSAILVSGPANGTLTLNANGTFSYTHNGSETTADSFTYRANDGTANGNIVTVNIGVTPVNDAPQATDVSASAVQGGAEVAISLSGSDPDIGDAVESFRITSLPDHGTLQINGVAVTAAAVAAGSAVISATDAANGLLTYLPPGDFDSTNDGPAPTFGYQAFDGDTYSAGATVTVNVADAAPVAVDDFVVLTEGSTTASVNLVIMLDTSATMVSPFLGGVVSLPGGGTTTRLALAQSALENLITSYGGSLQNVMLVTFDDTATYHGWFNDPAAAIAAIRGVSTGTGTNFDDALKQVQTHYGTPPEADHTFVYFLSDGYPATPLGANRPSVSISSSERDGWVDFVTDKGVDSVYAVGIGAELVGDYAQSNLDTVAWSPSGNPPLTWNTDDGLLHNPGDFVQESTVHNPNTIVVVNPLDLNGVLQGTVQVGGLLDGSVSGNVADDFGADGPAAQKVVGVSLDSDGDGIGDLSATFDGNFYQLDLGTDIGLLKIDAHSGNYSFTPASTFNIDQDVTFKVVYTIEDSDGSQASATLHLTLESAAGGGLRMAPAAAAFDSGDTLLPLEDEQLLMAEDPEASGSAIQATSGFDSNKESIDLADLLQSESNDLGAYIDLQRGSNDAEGHLEPPVQNGGGEDFAPDGLDIGGSGIMPAAIINSLIAGADHSMKLDQ
ncbi:retention module-containing protein [Pseudomonas sp. PDM16]|uniref:retention module-containing protein n=1 Tax=Pseudomonas sp. PDM16 TaxID=2769292 RepID=UPI001785907B|nr:retention module-containing protein [Pseudomonas sp. PDM16]MBD9414595.1 retention module-containing protein [Pseudomonas sp. PDM16]